MKTHADTIISNHRKISDNRFSIYSPSFTFTVPTHYRHNKQLETFSQKTKELNSTIYFSNNLNDTNFRNVTHQLMVNKTYVVNLFEINDKVSSYDCLNFLESQNALLVGAQGLSLIHEIHHNKFCKGISILSFDRQPKLMKTITKDYWVPYFHYYPDACFEFLIANFDNKWGVPYYLSSTSDVLLCVKPV